LLLRPKVRFESVTYGFTHLHDEENNGTQSYVGAGSSSEDETTANLGECELETHWYNTSKLTTIITVVRAQESHHLPVVFIEWLS
jgi:hypothetical protein